MFQIDDAVEMEVESEDEEEDEEEEEEEEGPTVPPLPPPPKPAQPKDDNEPQVSQWWTVALSQCSYVREKGFKSTSCGKQKYVAGRDGLWREGERGGGTRNTKLWSLLCSFINGLFNAAFHSERV